MNEQFYNYTLEEKIYSSTAENTKDELETQINLFSKELITRRRKKAYSGGLQAVMIILNDSFGAKVNEDNGNGTHLHSYMNLIKFLNGDYNYITSEGTNKHQLLKKETSQQYNESINIRILDGEERIDLAIYTYRKELSPFQQQVLDIFLDTWNEIKKENIYKEIKIGMYLPGIKMEACDNWYEQYQKLDNELNKKNK